MNESPARRVVDETLLACKSAVNGIVVAPCVQLDDCEISKLHYIPVGVASTNHSRYITVIALEDGGAQLAVANRSVIAKLDDVSVIGSVKIGLALGDSVTCDLVRLNVCPVNADGSANIKHTVTITCAVSDIANDELLIPADIVKRWNNVIGVDDDTESCCSDDIDCDENDINSDECSDIDNDCNENEIDDLLHVNVVTRSGRDTVSAAANVAAAARPRPIVCQLNRAPDTTVNNDGPDSLNADCDTVNADIVSDIPVDAVLSASTRGALIDEQNSDPSLSVCWKLYNQGKGTFDVVNGVLMRKDRVLGQDIQQLVLPQGRRQQVLEYGHGLVGAHMAWRNTSNRIRLNFWWPTIRKDIIQFVSRCDICQHKSRITCWDRVPIQPIPRAETPFSHWFMDIGGPLSSEKLQYNYFLVLCDSYSRFPMAYALRTVTSKTTADCLLSLWQIVGCPSWVSSEL